MIKKVKRYTNYIIYKPYTVNENLRQIRIIKPSQIANISSSFKKSIRG
jgi:hypothetical protein